VAAFEHDGGVGGVIGERADGALHGLERGEEGSLGWGLR
jgi:hypothetical protein